MPAHQGLLVERVISTCMLSSAHSAADGMPAHQAMLVKHVNCTCEVDGDAAPPTVPGHSLRLGQDAPQLILHQHTARERGAHSVCR